MVRSSYQDSITSPIVHISLKGNRMKIKLLALLFGIVTTPLFSQECTCVNCPCAAKQVVISSFVPQSYTINSFIPTSTTPVVISSFVPTKTVVRSRPVLGGTVSRTVAPAPVMPTVVRPPVTSYYNSVLPSYSAPMMGNCPGGVCPPSANYYVPRRGLFR